MNECSSDVTTAELLGFRVNPGAIQDYINLVEESIVTHQKRSIFYHNLHTLHEYFKSSELRKYYRNTFVLVDGMPIIPLLKLAGFDVGKAHRITYVDFIWPLLQRANEQGWRVFVVGQSETTLQAAFQKIRQCYPDIQFTGHNGFFNTTDHSSDTQNVVKQINDFGADICLVGMGTPRQEQWVYEHRRLIDAPALLVCGACMEYVAGVVKTPPRWMGRWGLEWSYRFFENPKRFAWRYVVEPWLLTGRMLMNMLSAKKA